MLPIITAPLALLSLLFILALQAWRPDPQHTLQPSSSVYCHSFWGGGHGFVTPCPWCCSCLTKPLTGKGHGDREVWMEDGSLSGWTPPLLCRESCYRNTTDWRWG